MYQVKITLMNGKLEDVVNFKSPNIGHAIMMIGEMYALGKNIIKIEVDKIQF